MKTLKKTNLKNNDQKIQYCTNCNPKKYLKFNFSFVSFDSKKYETNDIASLFERMKFLSSEPFAWMMSQYQSDKKQFFEIVSVKDLGIKKEIPKKFREVFPQETNEKFAIFRVYPNNNPKNARIIGMLKNTIFYIFYLDWNGELYKH